MAQIEHIQNGEQGLSVRNKLNALIDNHNNEKFFLNVSYGKINFEGMPANYFSKIVKYQYFDEDTDNIISEEDVTVDKLFVDFKYSGNKEVKLLLDNYKPRSLRQTDVDTGEKSYKKAGFRHDISGKLVSIPITNGRNIVDFEFEKYFKYRGNFTATGMGKKRSRMKVDGGKLWEADSNPIYAPTRIFALRLTFDGKSTSHLYHLRVFLMKKNPQQNGTDYKLTFNLL